MSRGNQVRKVAHKVNRKTAAPYGVALLKECRISGSLRTINMSLLRSGAKTAADANN
jgi:hypothetical protein